MSLKFRFSILICLGASVSLSICPYNVDGINGMSAMPLVHGITSWNLLQKAPGLGRPGLGSLW